MSATDDGGPAFPVETLNLDGERYLHNGMSLRDFFAAKAMLGIVSASGEYGGVDYVESSVAKSAYLLADAMLKARKS